MPAAGKRDRILRQFLRLVDLSGDLDRNRSDGDFADAGGTLLQVVDENIFEMFIRPSHHREAVETFYAPVWASGENSNAEWRSFETQAALITAEFILSKREDSSSATIYMSDHHRWELAHRVERLTNEIRDEVNQKRKAARRGLQTKIEISTDLRRGRLDRAKKFAEGLKQPTLVADLEELADAPTTVRDRFQMARIGAAFFAENELIEPLDQLRRSVAWEIRNRLSSIQAQYQLTRTEGLAIETDADRWYDRLTRELKQPGHRRRLRAQRQYVTHTREGFGKALRNDARTIAFLQWVARNRLQPEERLVFITGDALLFDAYRRWHVESDQARRPQHPFILRRATQYAPIFNPSDSGGDLAFSNRDDTRKSTLFTLIQAALEAALVPLPFTIDMTTRSRVESGFNLTRERLGLKLVDVEVPSQDDELGGLIDVLSDEWIEDRAHEIENIRESWQRAQRFAIGASTDLIVPRIGKELEEAATQYFDAAKDAGPILRDYVTGVFEKLVDDSIELWVPLARAFHLGQFDEDPKSASFARRFAAALPTTRSADRENKPVRVFSYAACRALEIQDTASANRFASLARRADRLPGVEEIDPSHEESDLLYLHAVTYRYMICTVDSHYRKSRNEKRRRQLVSNGIEQAKTYYGQAGRLIDKCVAVHAADIEDPRSQDHQRASQIRYLRAVSERAALNLFMATSFGLASRLGSSPLLDDYIHHLEIARRDLWRCVKFDSFDDSDVVLDLARAQYVPNVAGYEVLAFILAGESEFEMQSWPRKVKRQIKEIWRSPGLHPLLTAELLGYFILSGDDEEMRISRSRKPKAKDQRQLKLPLDRELYRAIFRDIPYPEAKTGGYIGRG